jgi:hypothetical protein
MPKDDIKIIKLDPLAEKLDKAGFKGGASRRISKPKKLSKEGKAALKETIKRDLRFGRATMKAARRGDFGSPMMSQSAGKSLKAGSKESRLKSEINYPAIRDYPKNISTKGKDEARKYLKRKKKEYERDAKFFQKRGLSTGGLIKGFPKLAKRGF